MNHTICLNKSHEKNIFNYDYISWSTNIHHSLNLNKKSLKHFLTYIEDNAYYIRVVEDHFNLPSGYLT